MGTRIDRRFDYLRQKTEQEANQAGQKANEDLTRQAAARGRLGSGNFIKQQAQLQDQVQKQKQNALEGVESQRDMALQQTEEAQLNRDFARGEREASQKFGAEQNLQNLQFQAGENLKNRQFATGERIAGQEFSSGMFDKQQAARQLELDQAQKNWEKQFATQNKQWTKQFKLDKRVSEFNMQMAQRAQALAEKPGLFDRLMGMSGGGTLNWAGDTLGVGGSAGGFIDSFSGGGGGGGKIICTEYCRQGWISEEVLKGDLAFGKKYLSPETRANYFEWAQHVVPALRKYPVLLYVGWPIVYNWSHYMAWKMGTHPHKPLFGPTIEMVARFLSNIVGRTIRKLKRSDAHGSASISA